MIAFISRNRNLHKNTDNTISIKMNKMETLIIVSFLNVFNLDSQDSFIHVKKNGESFK